MTALGRRKLLIDRVGSDHCDIEVARNEAIRRISVILDEEAAAGSALQLNRSIFFSDSGGNVLAEVPFAAAVQ
jgi:hypothetical protein